MLLIFSNLSYAKMCLDQCLDGFVVVVVVIFVFKFLGPTTTVNFPFRVGFAKTHSSIFIILKNNKNNNNFRFTVKPGVWRTHARDQNTFPVNTEVSRPI